MRASVSIVFSDIFMCKVKKDVVVPAKLIFFKRYVYDAYLSRLKSMKNESFKKSNLHQGKIKLSIDIHPKKGLDTEIIRTKDAFTTKVYNKPKSFPVHWSSMISTKFKCDVIITDLYRAKLIATEFWMETDKVRKFHENTKLTNDIRPRKLLDSEIIKTKDTLTTQVYNHPKKFPVH